MITSRSSPYPAISTASQMTLMRRGRPPLRSWITPVKGAASFASVTEDGTAAAADSGSLFRYDATDRQWIYNWGTSKADANKQFTIGVRLDDGQVYSTVISLR